MIGLTILGFASMPTLGLLLLVTRQQRRTGMTILISLAVGLVIVLGLQYLALRSRPDAVRLLLPTPNFPSYPSGHASTAFGVAIILGLTYRKRRWWLIGLSAATLIAFSRLYLGLHYPSDILGGAILGAAIGAACYGILGLAQPDWRWLLWPQIAIALIVTHLAYLNILPVYLLTLPFVDKALHFLLFGAIVFWLNLWLKGRKVKLGLWSIPLAILLPLTIATLEEIAQQFSPFRTADLTDLASDLSGMLFFWWLSNRFIETQD